MPENSSCSSAGSCTKSSCEGCPSHNGGPQSFLVEQNKFSNIKHVIGVVSGKGGVGKSFVTSSLAVNMAKKGYKVGILDADITGPSIPKMFGAHDQILGDENGLMHPYETKEGIKLISVNLLMDNEEDPVIWRGPVIAGVVKQFWNETAWGDIDYLFVDMPPGTGDVPLHRIPVPPGRWNCNRHITTGACQYDCQKGLQHGRGNAYHSAWCGRKLQLSQMP